MNHTPKTRTVQVNVMLTPEERDRIEAIKTVYGTTLSHILRKGVDFYTHGLNPNTHTIHDAEGVL